MGRSHRRQLRQGPHVRIAGWRSQADPDHSVILLIDTSSARSVMALIDPAGGQPDEVTFDARETPPAMQYQRFGGAQITKVAVATGPGSFTGLRVGVSFGLGLAIGLKAPIVPLRTLEVQAARSDEF